MNRIADTSREAYRRANLPKSENQVWEAIVRLGGRATDPEIVQASGVPLNVVNGARNALMDRGLVRDSGYTKLNPKTRMRNKVWEAIKKQDDGPREPTML